MARVVASHEEQRGEIIRLLVPDRGLWVKLKSLQKALTKLGIPLPNNPDLQFHLRYLNETAPPIIVGEKRCEQPGYDIDRQQPGEKADDIVLIKLTNQGLNMYDRKVACDPGVDFGW